MLKAQAVPFDGLGTDQISQFGAFVGTALDHVFEAITFVDGLYATLTIGVDDNAEDVAGRFGDAADHLSFISVGLFVEPCQHFFAPTQRWSGTIGGNKDFRRRAVFFPLHRACHDFTVQISAGDFDDADRRQAARFGNAVTAAFTQHAVVFHFFEDFLQRALLFDVEFEGTRDLAFADFTFGTAHEFGDFVFAGKRGICHARNVIA